MNSDLEKIALLEKELKMTKNKLWETELRLVPTIEDCMTFGYTRDSLRYSGVALSACMDEWRENGRKPRYTYIKSFWEKARDFANSI